MDYRILIKVYASSREEEARRQQEEARKTASAESRADWRLSHVYDYLRRLEGQEEVEFDGFSDRWNTSERLKATIRPLLVKELLAQPQVPDEEIQKRIEALVDEHLDEVLEA